MQSMPGYELAKELLKRGIHTTGTIQANRKGLPVELGKKYIYIQSWQVVNYKNKWRGKG